MGLDSPDSSGRAVAKDISPTRWRP